MMKRQLHRMRQLAHTGSSGRTPETAEFLGEDLLQVEQRLEPAKRAAHNVHKRLQACLQGQSGADMDKRVKKLPLMALSTTMAESFKELDPDSSMGKALEMTCAIQNQLARILAEFEMTLERDVLQPLSRLSEEELPAILKHKKSLQKLVSDWNTLKSRLSQAAKNSGSNQGLGGASGSHTHTTTANKVEMLKEEEEELKKKVEQCKDEYLADLYHFSTKEDSYANYFIHLLEIQADYHRKSLTSLDTALAELRDNHSQADHSPLTTAAPFSRVYGVSLRTHLQDLGRDIALPIEACVLLLLSEGMQEEGLFRLAAGASVLKRLKQTMASDPHSLEEFCSDPHAVAGALKSYLRELPEPLMTSDLYDDWMRAASLKEPGARLEALHDVCSRLPQENFNNLRYLMKFLALLAEEQDVNKMTPSNIAIVLGPNLLWPPEKEGDQAQLDAASVSSIQVVGVVEALIQNADTLFPGDINFNVSGIFPGLAPQEKVSSQQVSEELPPVTVPAPATTPAPTPAPASMAVRERTEADLPKPTSPKVSRNPTETAASAEDMTRKTKRPAPARPTMPPPQPSSTRSSPPAPSLPPGSVSPGTPQALPRRLVGTSLRAPTMPPPLPPVPPQPARRQSRRLPASPVISNMPAQVDQGVATEDRGGPEAVGGHPPPPALPPQPRPRGLISETE
ncbi:SH3 domain-binding protein 1 isoform 1 [Mus musculus]|uniref:SH3 domain-binding protein 1 n=1 Tax=Mus musculus TaxID=10090 RepID=3BP1_MOUSE|nr:SH3 domain-binding protein 1 isoform 1 [Mus musculus]P55194.3 RecName: Full=SH3 domain-binding protein 1; Short=3BP-1 [Mus musculus]|eukprot:NP_001303613.1 SH3 domain-binding protein 1 isoform 1 [Mus musculus]